MKLHTLEKCNHVKHVFEHRVRKGINRRGGSFVIGVAEGEKRRERERERKRGRRVRLSLLSVQKNRMAILS